MVAAQGAKLVCLQRTFPVKFLPTPPSRAKALERRAKFTHSLETVRAFGYNIITANLGRKRYARQEAGQAAG